MSGRTVVTFTEEGGVTTMVLVAAVTVAQSLRPAIEGMDLGWSQSLERLATLIEKESQS
jgi:uncharacterized protein YndB with AHSA1/START domain